MSMSHQVAGLPPAPHYSVQNTAENLNETVTCYSVRADADPGLLSRLLHPIAKRGLVADRLNCILEGGSDPVMLVDIQISGLDVSARDIVGAVMGQVIGVRSVLVCDKVVPQLRTIGG